MYNISLIMYKALTIAEMALDTFMGFPLSAGLSLDFCSMKQQAGSTQSSN